MNKSLKHGASRLLLRRPVMAAAAIALSAMALSGCAGINYPAGNLAMANAVLEKGYSLSAGDKVKVVVFEEPNLSGEFEIDKAGLLSLPLIGPVSAVGKTTADVATAIGAALVAGGYVLEPRVSVESFTYRPFYVLGEVSKPGEFAFEPQMSLLQAVAKAGGYTARANRGKVVLQRAAWTTPRTISLTGESLLIAPGDTIIIQESFL